MCSGFSTRATAKYASCSASSANPKSPARDRARFFTLGSSLIAANCSRKSDQPSAGVEGLGNFASQPSTGLTIRAVQTPLSKLYWYLPNFGRLYSCTTFTPHLQYSQFVFGVNT